MVLLGVERRAQNLDLRSEGSFRSRRAFPISDVWTRAAALSNLSGTAMGRPVVTIHKGLTQRLGTLPYAPGEEVDAILAEKRFTIEDHGRCAPMASSLQLLAISCYFRVQICAALLEGMIHLP